MLQNSLDLGAILRAVVQASQEVGAYIKSERVDNTGDDVITKSKNSFVSYVDKQAEQKIVQALVSLIPEAGFIAEEGTKSKVEEEYNWIIDPLDGTTNFLHEIPFYCISIALQKNNEIVLGVVHEVNRSETFCATLNGGSFLNGSQIHVSKNNTLSDSLLATGFPYYDYEYLNGYLKLLGNLMEETRGIRRLGAAALDLCYVACGRFEGFFEYGLSPWDVAAGSLIVKEAGGVVQDFRSDDDYLFGKEIIACNPSIHEILVSKIQNYINAG
ncbi:MAG: inositol monophosphatase [Flavobacteriales bacterium]|nr:inositol monophosphatase [Flavobacteriales bacterium]